MNYTNRLKKGIVLVLGIALGIDPAATASMAGTGHVFVRADSHCFAEEALAPADISGTKPSLLRLPWKTLTALLITASSAWASYQPEQTVVGETSQFKDSSKTLLEFHRQVWLRVKEGNSPWGLFGPHWDRFVAHGHVLQPGELISLQNRTIQLSVQAVGKGPNALASAHTVSRLSQILDVAHETAWTLIHHPTSLASEISVAAAILLSVGILYYFRRPIAHFFQRLFAGATAFLRWTVATPGRRQLLCLASILKVLSVVVQFVETGHRIIRLSDFVVWIFLAGGLALGGAWLYLKAFPARAGFEQSVRQFFTRHSRWSKNRETWREWAFYHRSHLVLAAAVLMPAVILSVFHVSLAYTVLLAFGVFLGSATPAIREPIKNKWRRFDYFAQSTREAWQGWLDNEYRDIPHILTALKEFEKLFERHRGLSLLPDAGLWDSFRVALTEARKRIEHLAVSQQTEDHYRTTILYPTSDQKWRVLPRGLLDFNADLSLTFGQQFLVFLRANHLALKNQKWLTASLRSLAWAKASLALVLTLSTLTLLIRSKPLTAFQLERPGEPSSLDGTQGTFLPVQLKKPLALEDQVRAAQSILKTDFFNNTAQIRKESRAALADLAFKNDAVLYVMEAFFEPRHDSRMPEDVRAIYSLMIVEAHIDPLRAHVMINHSIFGSHFPEQAALWGDVMAYASALRSSSDLDALTAQEEALDASLQLYFKNFAAAPPNVSRDGLGEVMTPFLTTLNRLARRSKEHPPATASSKDRKNFVASLFEILDSDGMDFSKALPDDGPGKPVALLRKSA